MATATNQTASTALRGKVVKVTLNSTETGSKLPNVTEGQKVTIGSSSKVGYVDTIDIYGNSFTVIPLTPATNLESPSTPGVLDAAETITLT